MEVPMSDATITRPRELTAGVGVLGAPDVTEVDMVDDRTTPFRIMNRRLRM